MTRTIRKTPKKISLYPVTSSTVDSVGFLGDSIFVKYQKGTIYEFKGFEIADFVGMMESESIGKAIHATGVKGTLVTEQLNRFVVKQNAPVV